MGPVPSSMDQYLDGPILLAILRHSGVWEVGCPRKKSATRCPEKIILCTQPFPVSLLVYSMRYNICFSHILPLQHSFSAFPRNSVAKRPWMKSFEISSQNKSSFLLNSLPLEFVKLTKCPTNKAYNKLFRLNERNSRNLMFV